MSTYAKRFQDLEVYKMQRSVSRKVFELSTQFPADEKYSLTDQIRRSSRSIGAQIAESWAKRLYPKHFVSKLTDADGEQLETQHWLTEARDCEYINTTEFETLIDQCERIGRMLGSMIQKADMFASTDYRIKEEAATYLTNG